VDERPEEPLNFGSNSPFPTFEVLHCAGCGEIRYGRDAEAVTCRCLEEPQWWEATLIVWKAREG
jgi:hypothetical protein